MTRRRPYRRGMTLVELTLGLAITSIVTLALGSFVYAMAAGWRQAEVMRYGSDGAVTGKSYVSPLAQLQAVGRIEAVLRAARLTGTVRPGPTATDPLAPAAALMFWSGESALADGKIQFSEIGLIEYEPASRSLWLYTVALPAGWGQAAVAAYNGGHVAADEYGYGNLVGGNCVESFKQAAHVARRGLAKDVLSCRIAVRDATASRRQLPSVDLVLEFSQGKGSGRQVVTATLRLADPKPYQLWSGGP